MCGVAGLIDRSKAMSGDALKAAVAAMTAAVHHRGPDDKGIWIDEEKGVGLGQRRLSIVDLSAAGHQPMISGNGRHVIVYNGEVYGYGALRSELIDGGVNFRGHSDTEVILENIAARGVAATVERLIGMFAFAVWDRQEETLTLVRDRVGIKPLYWAEFGDLFLFGSELKALVAHPGWTPEADRDAVAGFLRHNYVPGPGTIYRGVHKLQPGSILTVSKQNEIKITKFWDLHQVYSESSRNRLQVSDEEAVNRLESLLKEVVGLRMIADVPIGAFLSGGIDSSLVTALMQAQSPRPVRTFTIGFRESEFDEAPHGRAVAAHLGTEHTELTVLAADAREIIPRLPDLFDEPFADFSQIPTCILSELTRRHVTVALSGDGGDELFAGYTRYTLARSIRAAVGWLPPSLRGAAGAAVTLLPPSAWDALSLVLPKKIRPERLGDRLHKLVASDALRDEDALYRRLVSHWPDPDAMVKDGHEIKGPLWDEAITAAVPDFVERMQFKDLLTYLPDDILTKIDRASMAASLEARVPLLDHRLAAFAFRLPERFKIRDGTGKWILRQVLYRHVPPVLVDRPKTGFGIPMDAWLRGPLRDWAESLLDHRRLLEGGLVEPEPVRRLWAEHLSGARNWQYPLWGVLMLEAWRARWLSGQGRPGHGAPR